MSSSIQDKLNRARLFEDIILVIQGMILGACIFWIIMLVQTYPKVVL